MKSFRNSRSGTSFDGHQGALRPTNECAPFGALGCGHVGQCFVQPDWVHAGVEELVMSRQRVSVWNAVVWAVVMLAVAVVLKGVDGSVFVAALMALIVGAAGIDALLVRALPLGVSRVRGLAKRADERAAGTGSTSAFGRFGAPASRCRCGR